MLVSLGSGLQRPRVDVAGSDLFRCQVVDGCNHDSHGTLPPTSPIPGIAYPGVPICPTFQEVGSTSDPPLQAPRITIILIFPDSPGKPVAVRASTAITVTVDGKTAIAAGKSRPELWWERQGKIMVKAGRAGLAQLEHLSSWPEAISSPAPHTQEERRKVPWIQGL